MGRCWMLLEGNKTRPAETFCYRPWKLPASAEHRGGVRKRRGGWRYRAPGALCKRGGHTDWLTAHSAFQSASTYLCHGPFGGGKKKLLFCAEPLLWASPYDLRDNGADWEAREDSILQTFYFPFIFYQYESHRHQVVWSSERDVLVLS